jgi:hypothetical protein
MIRGKVIIMEIALVIIIILIAILYFGRIHSTINEINRKLTKIEELLGREKK